MDALPYYKWLWRDWRANRRVQRMSWQAQGLYRSLLDEFWAEGVIPSDLVELADICGCPVEVMEQFWPEIAPCWVSTEHGYMNSKMDEQRTAKDSERVAKANAGRSGGLVSNSRTRAEDEQASAKQVLAEAKQFQAQPDIAEQSRALAEHTQEQSKVPSRGKRETQSSFVLPQWIDATAWKAFEELRARGGKRTALTDSSRTLCVRKLESLKRAGHHPTKVLNQSVMNGYQGLFEIKGGSYGAKTRTDQTIDATREAAEAYAYSLGLGANGDQETGPGIVEAGPGTLRLGPNALPDSRH